ncbi:MAG: class I poly(R)-hydroxyalkanoic acid synthase [Rhodocyclaceae bacterium]|uniref:Class I poly(R)-hydroxyalkanoic acid synthase n=1 Tax=Fluviibacter phosphoraccumulans TaxID=1751046 RepID=A0A679HX99_9RHOO|nr:class I poly(R)-hydroxyalkanoic acid synthase [Fluviibacter phosphoraccumulans]MBP7918110.1 class I poly(R)-hydroxyalkanoic acid synthase [Rhodocyclaceae bacterium]MBP7991197.1 class I poly(R)-hydroxyalkanoic acid synthase [Rhodocyclaceae bacterium]BBU68355.1 class I poly(R)-hydroxyalkanoic acid synthase [Fluviibacter phosphoraccumulans]BBU70106.1 class I poly(R)-hydroxyalkanoic acid synthase [Fluviibacter phosphoraccumulans]BCA66538.1 class I poly(R)-hydroxyalkanoic acid synthase [Fluviiba
MSQSPTPAEGAEGKNPAELVHVYSEVAQRASRVLSGFIERQAQKGATTSGEEVGIAKAFMDLSARLLSNPYQLAQTQMNMAHNYFSLWQNSVMRMMGMEAEATVAPERSDKRFKDEGWQQDFVFDFIKQSYLIASKHILDTVGTVEGMDDKQRDKVNFYTRQYIDALSPSNFALTNPEVFRETVRSQGQNLVKGLNNLLHDVEAGDGKLRIRMTDTSAFELGKNVATTKGKVVYQNEMFQLIHYEPTTKEQFKVPLLIVPPWINKFYILDLREKNSFVKWTTDQGHSTFIISWLNPDEQHADLNFEDYMLEGSLAAINAVEQATGSKKINTAGYCLGGTLLMSTLAYMAAKKDTRVNSATFFTTMLDFTDPGELGVFIDEESISSIEKKMEKTGYLDGSEMAGTFSMLRANDLVWSFVINNYLMGKDPFPFDLLYWNSDSTRMPRAMHSFYLRNMYLKNILKEPGGLTLGGVPIDIRKVKTPCYFVSAIEDHIAPWISTYMGVHLPSGPVNFVLGGSGHIAGIVNPPAGNKYCYWTNPKLPETAQEWFQGATQNEGSWWPNWEAWVKAINDEKVAARIPGAGPLKAIEDAPGSFVKMRADVKKPAATAAKAKAAKA